MPVGSPDSAARPAAPGAVAARPAPRRAAEEGPPNELTIEQLAAEVGMSVRNIRNHHTRGLLPAPEVRSRVFGRETRGQDAEVFVAGTLWHAFGARGSYARQTGSGR